MIFRLYLIIAILFLLPICFLITLELFESILYYYILFINNNNLVNMKIEDCYILIKYYIKKKRWLSCILMLELLKELHMHHYSFYYMYIGLCYQKILYNQMAKYYYLQSLIDDSSNLLVLEYLAYIYRNDGDNINAINIYRKMISIDSSNPIAIKYLKILVKS